MYVPLVFWFALALPGFAVVCRFDRKQLNSGLLGILSLSYLASLALLSPVAIVGYILGAPLAVFSGACVLLVAWGVLEVVRHGRWRSAAALLLGAVSVELLIVVADMILGARAGSIVSADAITHLARIRFLLDHGLSNADPFVGGHFFPTYHTNLLHALCAACSQLTGVDHFGVWFISLVWAKLAIAGGSYYLARSVFRGAWPAWVAVVFMVGTQGPITFMLYPNKLAPFWLLATLIGLTIRAAVAPTKKSVVWIAAATLVVAQVHALYGGFALVLLAPALIAQAVPALARRRRRAARLLLCTLALGLALPFIWVSVAGEYGGPSNAPDTAYQTGTSTFVRTHDGWLVKAPWTGFGGGGG